VVIINKLKLTNVSCSKKKQHHHSWRARNSPIIVLHFDHQKVGAYLIKSPFGWMKHFWFWAESPEPLPNTEKSETFHPESPRNISYFNIRKENHPKGCCALILFHFRGNQDWYKLSKWFCFNRKSFLGGKNNLDPKRLWESGSLPNMSSWWKNYHAFAWRWWPLMKAWSSLGACHASQHCACS
jgi:glycosyltransferase involved in cell wall biosynthesis